MVLTGFRT